MRAKLILFLLVLYLALCIGSSQAQTEESSVETSTNGQEMSDNQWYNSIVFDGYINFEDKASNALAVHMLPGDSLEVSVNSELPVNVIITDNTNSYTNYIIYGRWGDTSSPLNVWSYDEDVSAFNTQNHSISFEASDDRDIFIIIDDASGNSNNAPYVKIIRNQKYSDDYHNQIAKEKHDAYIRYWDIRRGDRWAESFNYT